MKQTRTRILSLLLALIMCLGLLPVTALAAGGSSGEPYLFLDPNEGPTSPPSILVYGLGWLTITFGGAEEGEECTLTAILTGVDGSEEKRISSYPSGTEVRLQLNDNEIYEYSFVPSDGSPVTGNTSKTLQFTITSDITICAQGSYRDATRALTLDYNGAGDVRTENVKIGSTFTLPTPTLPGYRFLGWYTGTPKNGYLTQYRSYNQSSFTALYGDLTLYAMWEKESASGYTITFDPNGGTVNPTSKQTGPDGKVPGGYPTPTREGYKFLGWYTDSDDYKPAEDEVWSGDQTLVAKWEKAAEAARVTFYPNGGRITKFKGVTVPEKNDGPFYIDEAGTTGVDMNSGWGWTLTGENGLVDVREMPTVERAGYTFDGWYIVSGSQANQAGDGKLTDFSGLSRIDISTAPFFPDGVELAAKWTAAETVTVSFDLNGMPGNTPKEQKVAKGGKVELPELAVPDQGIKFRGWCLLENNRMTKEWTADMPVQEDMTLCAWWEGVKIPGEDTFQFSNSNLYFNSYHISDTYYGYLVDGESTAYKERIRTLYNRKWAGSCFGMSAVYCMGRAGQIGLGTFQNGAKLLWDLQYPILSTNVQDLINFYMLSQKTSACTLYYNVEYYFEDFYTENRHIRSEASRNQKIVNSIEGKPNFALLAFNYGPSDARGGHAIVARSVSRGADGNYHIEIWDPNYPSTFGEVIISSDYSSVWFGEKTMNSGEYNIDPELSFLMPISQKAQHYDAKNLESVFGKNITSHAQTSNSNIYTLSSSVADFSIATADGRSAVVKNGKQVSGNLPLVRDVLLAGDSDGYSYIIGVSTMDDFTVTVSGKQAEVEFLSNDILVRVSSGNLNSVEVKGDSITTSCTSSSQQEITIVSDSLGDTWNKVTVSGKDTGFTLDAEAGQLKVSSKNNVSVTVQGENVDTWKTSAKQTVTASSSGTAVAMNTLAAAQQSTTPATTFPDVKPTAWYAPAVAYASSHGYMNGNADGTFNPDGQVKGTEFAQILYNKEGKPAAADGVSFKGVTDQWYAPAILWAAGKGIITDTGDTAIVPTASLTRQQIALMLYNYMGKPAGDADLNKFSDADKISAWAVDAVKWAVSEGIFKGNADGTFNPTGTAKRSETAQILMNFFG